MAIPAPHPIRRGAATPSARMRALFDELQARHPQVDTLSMGMSDDLELAIAEGATMVRIGTALFGEQRTAGRRQTVAMSRHRGPDSRIQAAGTIAFIGGGNMARSLIGGLIARGTSARCRSASPSPSPVCAKRCARDFGVAVLDDARGGGRVGARSGCSRSSRR